MRFASLSLILPTSFLANALRVVNVTVDNVDPASSQNGCLVLQPDGLQRRSPEVSLGQFVHSCHKHTLRCDASVTLTFTGIAVYLIYPPRPHQIALSATLDFNSPIFVVIPGHSSEAVFDAPTPVWGISGLPDIEHTLSISNQGQSDPIYVDAFMYTSTDRTEHCRRRQGAGEPGESPVADDADTVLGSGSSSAVSPTVSSSVSTSTSLTPTPAFHSTSSHTDVGIALGVVFGVLALTGLAFLAFRRHRRRRSDAYEEEKASSPHTPTYYVPAPEMANTRPPSMRERRDRFSTTHTPAGTPLTRSTAPASFLTSLSSNSMGLAYLSSFSHEKSAPASSSHGTASIQDVDMDAPPPDYETPQQQSE
ncbi:hypothetical protein C8F04DRAFT_1399440 [Mycena alexandri]|uniref:Uncharacterized protein n=1 Tax=Mycena alexandri TaxID=1745969 RepID=A0AAD6SJY3_9AGAR|nr:hypothetical protein C8F04DRAFT_1399440 [Mycena alexandri]